MTDFHVGLRSSRDTDIIDFVLLYVARLQVSFALNSDIRYLTWLKTVWLKELVMVLGVGMPLLMRPTWGTFRHRPTLPKGKLEE